jgi:hypothetical protein
MSFHNAGPFVEVFTTTGSNTLAQLYMKNSKQVKKEFNKDIKSFVVIVEGQSFHTSHIQLPKDEKANLNLMHRYVLLQLYVMKEKSFHIEFRVRDSKQQKQRLIFSTHFNHTQKNQLHTQFPLGEFFIGNEWINACFDLVDICDNILQCKYHTLDTIIIGPTCKLRKVFTMKQNPINEVFIPQKLNFPQSVLFHPETLLITSESFKSGESALRSSSEQHIEHAEPEIKHHLKPIISVKKNVTVSATTTPSNANRRSTENKFTKAPKTAGPLRIQTKAPAVRNARSAPPKKEISTRYSQEDLEELVEEEAVVMFPTDLHMPSNEEYNAENYVRDEPTMHRSQDDDDLLSVVKKSLRISEEREPKTRPRSRTLDGSKSAFSTSPPNSRFPPTVSTHISPTKSTKSNGSKYSPTSPKFSQQHTERSTSELKMLSPTHVSSSKKVSTDRLPKYTPTRTEVSFDFPEHNGTLSSSYLIDPFKSKSKNRVQDDDFTLIDEKEDSVILPAIEESADEFFVHSSQRTPIRTPTTPTPVHYFSATKKQPSIQRSTPALKMSTHMKKYVAENNIDDDDMVNMDPDEDDENPLDQFDQIFDASSPRLPMMKSSRDQTSLGKLQDRYHAVDEEDEDDKVELVYDDMIGCYYDPRTNKYYEMKE